MCLTCNNVFLLLAGKVDELNCVTADTDSEVCILFLLWVFHSVDELFNTEYVYVQVVCATAEVSVHYTNESICAFLVVLAQCAWSNGLCI